MNTAQTAREIITSIIENTRQADHVVESLIHAGVIESDLPSPMFETEDTAMWDSSRIVAYPQEQVIRLFTPPASSITPRRARKYAREMIAAAHFIENDATACDTRSRTRLVHLSTPQAESTDGATWQKGKVHAFREQENIELADVPKTMSREDARNLALSILAAVDYLENDTTRRK